ncbi:MAG TPA: dodecin [Polyangiaceae bacterium]|nr:dodecin [Polyangiaceae bacterium]
MSDHVYRIIELVGTSPVSQDEAIRNAIQRAGETMSPLRWFEVRESRGQIVEGKVAHWQVTVRIGATLPNTSDK